MTIINRYNHTLQLFLQSLINISLLKMELLNNSAIFTGTNTTRNLVNNTGAYSVEGFGWDVGGEPILSAAVTIVNVDGAKLTAADLAVTAVGGTIGPAYKALIYYSTYPLWFITFDAAQDAGVGTDFKFTFNASGLMQVNDP